MKTDSHSTSNAEEIMLAHQYLYYVKNEPIWTDYQYDKFCKSNGLDGNGGSDREDDYSEETKMLATEMQEG